MQDSALNIVVPQTDPMDIDDQFEDAVESVQQPHTTIGTIDTADSNSSPFVNNVDSQSQTSNQENLSPSRDKRRSRIMTGTDISPLKMLQRSSTEGPIPESEDKLAPPSTPKSPRKSISPMRRFPIKVNSIDATANTPRSRPQSMQPPARERNLSEPEQPRIQEREMSLDEAIAQNPGVKHAIEVFEDSISSMDDDDDDQDSPMEEDGATVKGSAESHTPPSDAGNLDDAVGDETMNSAFSTFSAIPNMTTFARLGGRTPTQLARGDPSRDSSASNLLDFTDNLRFPAGGRTSPTKAMTMADAKKTPQRQSIANLLDFDIPPMPTPRSVPSISARELESLKSNFMSEISSLKATLSGKQAEVTSFKTALMEAEKRAGDAMEQLREERSMREQFSEEKDLWEKRGREMETVLRQVKEEILVNQRERDEFEAKLEESEGRREAAEMMAQEAESRMAMMRAREASAEASAAVSPGGVKSPRDKTSQREIEMAVEKVARELHAAYKQKHEAKVAALKKTYEGRWDKKIRELEGRLEMLVRENEELKVGRDTTITKVELERSALEDERRQQTVKDSAQIKELHAEVEKLEAVVRTVQHDNADLRQQLEGERVEKGELVTLAEELMQMQAQQSTAPQNNNNNNNNNNNSSHNKRQHQDQDHEEQSMHRASSTTPKRVPQRASAPVPARSNTGGGLARPATTTPKKAAAAGPGPSGLPGTKSSFRTSMIGRPGGGGAPSGLKPPGQSRIGGVGGAAANAHGRTQSNATTGIARPGSGLARPGSGLMSSISQMGGYRGRGE
ncbi:hypothetical protein VMCG_07903 [Cytospora schulzeri]|uniref:Kinetoplast-associated protein KAP n=1 Tax=Cytospora schulzeri TaxID=448051 RepID=A0A423W0I3_9PEZI|nr:hypothetical protein VMCG_07903 [Valsa malicola]